MQSHATTPQEYLDQLPPERKSAIEAVRTVILQSLPKGYQENIRWGMLSYEVPLEIYPDTYNGQPLAYAALANQKNYMALYLTNVYGSPELQEQFIAAYKAAGKKLDMGKSCVRFKSLDDLPLDVIGKTIAATPMDAHIKNAKTARRGRQ